MRRQTALFLLTLLASFSFPGAASAQVMSEEAVYRLVNQIRKEIVMLPNYGVFDSISFAIAQGTAGIKVQLKGYASRPTLKSSAESVVKRLEGVESVDNQIEVLPTSRNDENIRLATYTKIYGNSVLSRYNPNRGVPVYGLRRRAFMGISNEPPMGPHPIQIIVKNGNVALEGMVDTEADKNIAGMQANSVSGVFSVTNNLTVPQKEKK